MNSPKTFNSLSIFELKRHQLLWGWGPAGSTPIRNVKQVVFIISVSEGGQGKLWIDNLAFESFDQTSLKKLLPDIAVSSVSRSARPVISPDGRTVTSWRSSATDKNAWMTINLRRIEALGGLVIDWAAEQFATAFEVQISNDGRKWNAAYAATRCNGGRSYVPIEQGEAMWVKLLLNRSNRGRGYGITRLQLRGFEFSFSPNDLFKAIAKESPEGFYPKYFLNKLPYWTVVGVAEDRKEGLFNEYGTLEVDKRGFTLEPFLYVNDSLITWRDAGISLSLANEYLPIPSVVWHCKGLTFTITAFGAGKADSSVLFARYIVKNEGSAPATGAVFVTVRPFQVNPPSQDFTIVGGATRIDSIRWDRTLHVNDMQVIPLCAPDAAGAAEFDEGDVTTYLVHGMVPPSREARDSHGYASAALRYDFTLASAQEKTITIALPWHHLTMGLHPEMTEDQVRRAYGDAFLNATSFWESRLNHFDIRLPARADRYVHTAKSNLAYILINADSVGFQPGSRSYERSWIRDGSLTSLAMLQMGINEPVRRYIDWYAQYQYPDGKIPCIVEARGPDPVPEHDSPGQFIMAIKEYFNFTKDTTWLRGKWENVERTVRYIQNLRAQRKTEQFKHGTPTQRACFGLVPESISHEGYSPKPMHSYWDNFFVARGLKDAASIAGILGKMDNVREFAAERDDFRKDLHASIRLAMENAKIDFIPACVELGDFDPTSTTVGISPAGELGYLPEPELATTFERFYHHVKDRQANKFPWQAYLPYELRAAGTYLYLGQKDRALELLAYYVDDRRPARWNQWPEINLRDPEDPKFIGDMPHSWAGSDYIRTFRSLFVYERELDTALIIGAGIPMDWLDDSAGVRVERLPTYYGPLSYTLNRQGSVVTLSLEGGVDIPAGGIVFKSPLGRTIQAATINRQAAQVEGDHLVIRAVPAVVTIR